MRYFCVRCVREVPYPNEHRKPRGRGGSDDPENVQPMCESCHRWKHEHPRQAHDQGYTLLRHEPERAWWRDFPHARVDDGRPQ